MRALLALLLFATAAPLAAQPQSVVDLFEKRSHTFEGLTMPYRLFVPEGYDGSQAYPLVIALHGSGERGTDNERHIAVHRLATAWADPASQARHPAFVLAPQLPTTMRWTADAPVAQSNLTLGERAVLDILDALLAEFAIDPDRVYVVGLSLGGHATWDLVSRLPERFAAAVPMSGRADPTQAGKLMDFPLWIFHGESDGVVEAQGSRGILYEMERRGRGVVYTDCRSSPPAARNYDCGPPLPADSLRRAVEAGATLFYTGVRSGGHGPWAPWFDNAVMQDWLFRQHRLDDDALTIQAPAEGAVWAGTEAVAWTATGPATDSVRISLSLDDGATWRPVARVRNTGTYALDTTPFADSPVARVRLEAINAQGFVYGREVSPPFYLDVLGNAPPYARLDTFALRFHPRLTADTLTLALTAADPEQQSLNADLFWSIDGGTTYARFGNQPLTSMQRAQPLALDLAGLPNTSAARLRVDVSDGTSTVSQTTPVFAKQTPRAVGTAIEHVAGRGRGTIQLHVVDRAALTGSTYHVVLDSSDPFAKTYSVDRYDAYVGETPPPPTRVLTGIPLSDGVQESPAFDGLRLVVEDAETGMADLDKTGWVEGDSDLGVTIQGGRVRISILTVTMLDTEDTYRLTMTENVADTSVAMYALPATPMRFTLTAASDGQRREVVFKDADRDGRPGNGDVLYLLEPDAEGTPAPAWAFTFSATAATTLPEPGDVFAFVPSPKLGTGDVFAFIASTRVAVDGDATPDAPLLRAFPNPFGASARVAYTLPTPAHAALEVFDVLGRRVAVLADAVMPAGPHAVAWDGAGLAAGTYFIRLTLRPLDGGSSRTLHQAVVRVE